MRCDLVRTSALALAFVGSVSLAAAQQKPPPNVGSVTTSPLGRRAAALGATLKGETPVGVVPLALKA